MNTRTPEIYWILGGVLAVLSLATLIGRALKRRRPADAAIANLNVRLRSWWVLILIGGAALLAGRLAVMVLFAVVSFLALDEFLKQALVPPGGRALQLACLATVPVHYVLVWSGRLEWFSLWIPVCCLAALLVASLRRAAAISCGLIASVYGISHVPALLDLQTPGRTPVMMVFLVLIAQASDVLQYVWGKLIGRHRLASAISPSKTVEGLLGGILSATLLGALLWRVTPFTIWTAGLMAFLISTLGFLGGLAMSAIKRARGLKDWGGLIAGHGGVLDRVDSLCLSAPVFFHITRHFISRI